jgi:hypothetical protein
VLPVEHFTRTGDDPTIGLQEPAPRALSPVQPAWVFAR